jgi:hypothetical protein
MTRHLYRHYGLVIGSDIGLPGLAGTEGGSPELDIDVALSQAMPAPCSGLSWRRVSGWAWRADDADGSWLRILYKHYREWADFVIDPVGRRVWLSVSDGAVLADMAELLLGPVFSCVLSHRGLTCLHASVVEIGDRAIAFVGPKGAGKSTTAMASVLRGAMLVSDDVAVLAERGGWPVVEPGRARARMHTDTAAALSVGFADLQPVVMAGHGPVGKRVVQLATPRRNDAEALPLDAIVLLGALTAADAPPRMDRARPADALPRLMASRHMATLLDRSAHARDLAVLAGVLARVPVYDLIRPDRLAALDQTVDVITRTVWAEAD